MIFKWQKMQFHFKYQCFFNRDTRGQKSKSSRLEMHVIVCAQGQKITSLLIKAGGELLISLLR